MGTFRSLLVFTRLYAMDFNWFYCVVISLYESLWVLMGPFRSLCVLMDSNVSLWVLFGSLSVFINLHGSLCVFMPFYEF